MSTKPDHIYITIGSSIESANTALIELGVLPVGIDQSRVVIEPSKDPAHGDLATNNAIVLAKEAKAKPQDLARKFAEQILLKDNRIEKAEVAGPGFVNLTLKTSVWTDELREILRQGQGYGRKASIVAAKINVEYVSANPTGPMHVGHCRGAVFGDALCNLLQFAGYDVTREYYINDAGAQVDVLARSAFLRYREALGENIGEIPEGLYPGDYLRPVGEHIVELHSNRLIDEPESKWLPIVRQIAVEAMLIQIMQDLKSLNIRFDTFFSEKALSEPMLRFAPSDQRPALYCALESYNLMEGGHGGVRFYLAQQKAAELQAQGKESLVAFSADLVPGELGQPSYLAATLSDLANMGLVYEGRLPPPKGAPIHDWEDREQTLFRATAFGDDVDRPLKKSDGSYTYFASDIAYHRSKFTRGFRQLIDVWGADHSGYIKRMKAAVKAVTGDKAALDVKIVQLVRLLRNGEPVKMSKRSGDFVTLRDVVEEVGKDAVRFMMLFRTNDAVLDFDLAKVIEQSKDNAVFYVQYGHARGHSIFRNARAVLPNLPEDPSERVAFLLTAPMEKLTDPAELSLLRRLALYPRMIEAAAVAHEPHRIASYLYDLASEFHGLWHLPHLRFIVTGDPETTKARLALVQGVVTVLASGLAVLGVSAPKSM
jgi:arginyl-tRNA synthetase